MSAAHGAGEDVIHAEVFGGAAAEASPVAVDDGLLDLLVVLLLLLHVVEKLGPGAGLFQLLVDQDVGARPVNGKLVIGYWLVRHNSLLTRSNWFNSSCP